MDVREKPAGGRQRHFWTGVALTIGTLGAYAAVWHYRVYRELHEEFYLKPFPTRPFITMFVPVVGILAYLLYMDRWIGDLRAIRSKLGLQTDAVRLRTHVLLVFVGGFVLVGPLVAYKRLQASVNEVWQRVAQQDRAMERQRQTHRLSVSR